MADLAKAPDDGLGKLWEGLGYYSRMRNLRAAAQVVQEKWNGQIPRDYDAVRSLPGLAITPPGPSAPLPLTCPLLPWTECAPGSGAGIGRQPSGRPARRPAGGPRGAGGSLSGRPLRRLYPGAHGAGGHGVHPQRRAPVRQVSPGRPVPSQSHRAMAGSCPAACPSGSGVRRIGPCLFWTAVAGLPWSSGALPASWQGFGSSPTCRERWRAKRP